MKLSTGCAALVCALLSLPALAQYTRSAGQNAPAVAERVTVRDATTGALREEVHLRPVPKDGHGNARGTEHDLAVDGAFDGQTVVVLQLYVASDFDFELPRAALKEKGFSVVRWQNRVPPPKELERALEKANQLWVISGSVPHLTAAHVKVIRRFWEAGRGLYIWGDNEPYYADANALATALFGTQMLGNLQGEQTVGLHREKDGQKVGLRRRHLLSTGLEHLYEGTTIATLQPTETLQPLLYGSAGNLVSAFFDRDGKRAILDGGFTRLYVKWDTAGTGRYVKNAAAWLANAERFGTAVVGPAGRGGSVAAR